MSSSSENVMRYVTAGSFTLVFGSEVGQTPSSWAPGSDDLLQHLATDCHDSEVDESAVILQGIIYAMQFAANTQLRMAEEKEKQFTIFNRLVENSKGRLDKWWLNRYYSLGLKASLLAGAGSFYFLVLIAAGRVRTTLSMMSGASACELAKVLRCPDVIIPAIAELRATYPMSGDLVFRDSYIGPYGQAAARVELTELASSDAFYDAFDYKRVPEPPPASAPPKPIPNWDQTAPLPNMIIIETKYDPDLAKHRKLPYKRNRESIKKVTEQHKEWAKKAKIPTSAESTVNMVRDQLEKGHKGNANVYVNFRTKLFQDHIVRITDKDGNLVATILADMPVDTARKAFAEIDRIFPNVIKAWNSSGHGGTFYSLHLTYYNRYSKKGTGAPVNAEPSTIRRLGKQNVSTKVNIPRESKESEEYFVEKDELQKALDPMFRWISKRLKQLLPDTYEILSEAVEILPLGDTVPAHPFMGFVLNFNVVTRIHRDFHDKEICLVFQLSSCKGGELVLVEPGLVVAMENGHGILFKSHQITHLNLDYEGKRVSLVFHTDKAMDDWVTQFNGWGENIYFRFHRSTENDDDPTDGQVVNDEV
ncbi:hypothetical protein NMY22_g923 [Coprinellus aureogranulatus]|nr:hypothetical protein NMY22_g923 [Coprinellus aureogranulatus]